MNKTLLSLGLLLATPVFAQGASLSLAWVSGSPPGTPETFRVYTSKTGTDYLPLAETLALEYKVESLPLGRYHFRVTAYNDAGESDPSNEVSAYAIAPAANLKLDVAPGGYMYPAAITWEKSPSSVVYGDVKYAVYRRIRKEGAAWLKVAETFNTRYSWQVLQYGSFVYKVVAFTSEGEAQASNELNVRVELAVREG